MSYACGLLFVYAYGIDGLFVVFHRIVFAWLGVSRHLYAAKEFLYLAFYAVYIYVAHHYHALQVGTIPCLIVVAKHLVREVVHHVHRADGQAIAIAAVGIEFGQKVFENTHLTHHAHTPLFVYHLTL